MGRKVPVDPYIRSNWKAVSVKFPRRGFEESIVVDLESWCTESVPGRYAYEYCFLGYDYRGFNFYFKDPDDALLFKVTW